VLSAEVLNLHRMLSLAARSGNTGIFEFLLAFGGSMDDPFIQSGLTGTESRLWNGFSGMVLCLRNKNKEGLLRFSSDFEAR
jgi:hypothetical protein